VMKLVSSGRTTASDSRVYRHSHYYRMAFIAQPKRRTADRSPATHDPQHGRQRTPLRQARDVVTAKAARVARRCRYLNPRHAAKPRSLVLSPMVLPPRNALGYGSTVPTCRQIGGVDLRKLDRRRGATIESLIPALSCRRCSPARHHLIDLKPRLPRGPRVSTPPIARTIRQGASPLLPKNNRCARRAGKLMWPANVETGPPPSCSE
jgi:hypothetical protein